MTDRARMRKTILDINILSHFKPDLQSIKHRLQRWRWYRPLHLAYTGWRAHHGGVPDWETLLKVDYSNWLDVVRRTTGRTERILIATGAGGHLPSMTLESLLGTALTQRNAGVDFLLCDGALPACQMCEINWYVDVLDFARQGPTDRCQSCYRPAAHMLNGAGFHHLGVCDQLTDDERKYSRHLATTLQRDDIVAFSISGVSIGEHAMAGALRFFACGAV